MRDMFTKMRNIYNKLSIAVLRTKPRANRINLHKKPVHFYFQNYRVKPVLVRNLSRTGMGLKVDLNQKLLSPGEIISGRLKVGNKMLEIKMEVIYVNGRVAGCKFLKIPEGFRAHLQRQFHVEYTAKKLFPVNARYLATPTFQEEVCCFYGDPTEELCIISKGKTVVHFHLKYMGIYIEGGSGKAIMGMQKDDGNVNAASFKGKLDRSMLTGSPSFEEIQDAISFVCNVDQLQKWQFAQLSDLLETHCSDLPLAS